MHRPKLAGVVAGIALLLLAAVAFAQGAPSATASSPPIVTVILCVIAWPALTGIINSIFHLATPADVDAWAERNPTIAKIAATMRRAGFEPIALFTQLRAWASANPPPPAFFGGRAAMGKRRGYLALRELLVLASVGVLVAACALLGSPVLTASEQLALCEQNVAVQHPGASFAVIVAASLASCSGDAAILVADVVRAIAGSRAPELAPYRAEAAAHLQDPAKMSALRAAVGRP